MADADQVTITINGIDHVVAAGQLLITAAENIGEIIPRFCHHDKLEPVAKCRMCLVEVEGPRGKALVPSCTMPVSNGMVVDTKSAVVTKAHEGVLEFLLINHPLDCPICDKGGECPLQDQAYAHGPGESRFVEEKRTYLKPLPVSDLVLLDRERCVLCDRCVRVADDIAGDPLLVFTERGNAVQIQTFPDEPFASYFSGNTVQLCPVGALTSVDYRFKARPWDLHHVTSVSLVDTVQSTVDVQTSRGKIVRVYGVENDAVNEGWLSDKDRFVFPAIHADTRVVQPLVRNGERFDKATWGEALEIVASRLGSCKGAEVAAIGGAHNTNEDAFALGKFMRSVIGSAHIDAQIGDGLDARLAAAVTSRARLGDLDAASTILVWGPDLKEVLPVLYLRVRKATRNGATLVVVSPVATGLDSVADHVVRYRAGTGSELLRKLGAGDGDLVGARSALREGPVVALVGRTSLAEDPNLAESIAAFALSLPEAKILPLLERGNVFGALDMGLAPGLLPGRVSVDSQEGVDAIEDAWGPLPDHEGLDAMSILADLVEGDMSALVMVGSDPVSDCPDPQLARAAIEAADFVVAIDAFITDSSVLADVILPAAVWGEVDGTVTNLEGRVQRIRPSLLPAGQSRALHGLLDDIASQMGADLGTSDLAMISKEIASVAPSYAGITIDYLTFAGDPDGVVVPIEDAQQPLVYTPVDRPVPVVTGEFTLHLAASLYDAGVWLSNAAALGDLARSAYVRLHPSDAARRAITPGETIVVSGSHQLPVALDDTVSRGTLVVPHNLEETKGFVATPTVTVDTVRGEE
ncbi:MAG: NADH-quinone oxidoreductase subunit NuoG [Actinomycetia bacterium]|nr:NADH-quinone oxidoreductase subunit NuoG [Actinomycetes bacterium]